MSLLTGSVRDFLDEVAAPRPTATGGAVAAVTLAAAAGLCGLVASTLGWQDARCRADAARARASELVDSDGAAYERVLAVDRMREPRGVNAAQLRATALRAAALPPFELCRVAVDVADLAVTLGAACKPALRGDAVTAAELAAATARSAATLVRINLKAAGGDQHDADEADRLAAFTQRHAHSVR